MRASSKPLNPPHASTVHSRGQITALGDVHGLARQLAAHER
jgi:hypothetical protein